MYVTLQLANTSLVPIIYKTYVHTHQPTCQYRIRPSRKWGKKYYLFTPNKFDYNLKYSFFVYVFKAWIILKTKTGSIRVKVHTKRTIQIIKKNVCTYFPCSGYCKIFCLRTKMFIIIFKAYTTVQS